MVVVGDSVVGRFSDLNKAKEELGKHTSGSRLIAELKDGKLVEDPHQIAGEDQLPENGYNKHWSDSVDIHRMIEAAKSYGKYDLQFADVVGYGSCYLKLITLAA